MPPVMSYESPAFTMNPLTTPGLQPPPSSGAAALTGGPSGSGFHSTTLTGGPKGSCFHGAPAKTTLTGGPRGSGFHSTALTGGPKGSADFGGLESREQLAARITKGGPRPSGFDYQRAITGGPKGSGFNLANPAAKLTGGPAGSGFQSTTLTGGPKGSADFGGAGVSGATSGAHS